MSGKKGTTEAVSTKKQRKPRMIDVENHLSAWEVIKKLDKVGLFINAKDLAAHWGCTPTNITTMVNHGLLPMYVVKGRLSRYWLRTDLPDAMPEFKKQYKKHKDKTPKTPVSTQKLSFLEERIAILEAAVQKAGV